MKPLVFKKKVLPGLCSVAYCTNKCSGKMCSTCRCRQSRIADPVRYAFNNLRNRAKQRGLVFTITLEQFREWCVKVEYVGFAGRSSSSYTIDRKHNDIGYHIDNIQIMTRAENIKKYFSYDYRSKTALVTTIPKLQNQEEDYF